MRLAISGGIAAFAVLLAGCQGEAEEAPDITEAIPLDPETEDGDAAGSGSGNANGGAGGSGGEDETAGTQGGSEGGAQGAGNADGGNAGSRPQPRPGTMESGSNPPGMTSPPPGSKVQPAG